MPLSRTLVLCWSLTVAVGVQAAAVERVLVVSIDALHPAALTADAATMRVRWSTRSATRAGSRRRSSPSGTTRTSTPRARKASHGNVLFQCSPDGTTTLSPGAHP